MVYLSFPFMKKQQIYYRKEWQKVLQYAQLITRSDKKKMVSHLSLFWWVYVLLRQHEHYEIFWKLIGVKHIGILEDYFHKQYKELNFTELPNRFVIVKHIAQTIFSWLLDEKHKVDFVRLLYASVESPSVEAQRVFARLWIDTNTIKENCQYVMDHPLVLQIWMLAFLQLLATLIKRLALDINQIQLMQIDFMQHIPMMGQEQDVLDRDDNKSKVTTDNKKKKDEEKKMTVEYFWSDLTLEYKDGFLDPVIGREKEIDQMIYTLLRKTKNNPLLIGEAGVGKTAVVEWLAQRIAQGNVPEKLKNKKLFMLDMWSIVAWTKYRGEFESRMKAILEEAADPTKHIILFIDEIHSIIGAGWQDNNDAAQMIKPLLARWKIKLIGATTFDEYQKYIEKDKALKRRFQEISVDEPSEEVTKQILMGLKETYENYHGVLISEEAIDTTIQLARRYVLNKHFPDKAIDIIDEASARKSTISESLEEDEDYKKLEKKIEVLDKKIESAIEWQDYFGAAGLKEKQEKMKQELQQVRSQKLLPVHLRQTILPEDVSIVLSDKTGIPAEIVSEAEIDKLKRLKAELESHVMGQEDAVDAVVKSITRSRLSVVEKQKPISSFLFLGPSGTGKTYLAKMIAEHYFGDPKALIRVDMSEFMEKYSVSKLIGSAPGYVGHEEWGLLTEQVRRKPFSVILLDEVEKASRDVLNILLQILDEGHLKDNKGRWIDFKSTIIIMTSNIWSEEFSKKVATIGFKGDNNLENEVSDADFGKKKSRIMERVKSFLSPELMNRLDHLLVFRPLAKPVLQSILKKQLDAHLAEWKVKKWLTLPRFTKKKLSSVVDELYDPQYGARPLEKWIVEEVEGKMIEQMLD